MDLKVSPAKQVRGSVRTAGDKSVSHRYAMLAGIAEGTSEFENFSTSADCASTLGCMEALGATVRRNGNHVEVEGVEGALQAPARELDCGNSGSTMRMLRGVIEQLEKTGERIDSLGGCAELTIDDAKLRAVEYTAAVARAQVKSGE